MAKREAGEGNRPISFLPSLDWQRVETLADGWEPEVCAIFEAFLQAARNDLDALERAREDLAMVAELSHRLKGSAGNFGFTALSATAAEINRRAKAGMEPGPLLGQARLEFEQAKRELLAKMPPPAQAR